MARLSINRIHFYFILLFLAACASSKPKGQIVRLDTSLATEKKEEAVETKPVYELQAADATPADAAVFHFSMGQAYSLDNDPQSSIESYRAALAQDPNSAVIHTRLAAELVKVGSLAEAKILCEKAIELDAKYPDSYLLLAGIQVAAKEYETAIQTYKNVLEQEPNNRDALLYYGVTLAEVGKVKEGVQQMNKLVRLKDDAESNIDQAVAYYYLAKIYIQAGQKQDAIKAFQQSLKKRPGFAKAAISLADLYFEAKNEKKGYEILEEAFKESHASEIAERLAESKLEKNDFEGAVSYLETLVEDDPSNENTKLRLALVYWQLKWYGKAHLILSDLHIRYPASSEIAFYMGELELERKNTEDALLYYKKISADYNKYDQMVGRVVYVYREQKRYSEAENFLQDVLQKRSDIVSFYPLLAAIYEDQNKLEDAKNALERGRKLFNNDESILYYLGFLYDRMGDKKNGLEAMEKLLEINPNNANALNFVGYTLLESGEDMAKAAGYIKHALELKPEDPFVLDSYGWLQYRQGNYAQAMRSLEKAHGMKPEESIIAEHLADIYVAMHMPYKALIVYMAAMRMGGDEEFKTRLQNKIANVQNALADNKVPSFKYESKQPARVPASR